mmetsp:Transcript_9853/g.15780  ORF Transcript_9853/g.15780 Transcript_9853/m.15780 type:complete len:377 (-) Transcript_9853:23-1153(-)
MAVVAEASAPVKWASSGVGTPRHDRILALHRLHFVHKKGHDAVNEQIAAKCKEGRKADAKSAKEHTQNLDKLKADITQKFNDAMLHGSMSIWTQEQRDRIEDARHDPNEAMATMRKRTVELSTTYKQHKSDMLDRLTAKPPMNIRPREEREAIEAARQDPKEAKERIEAQLKERKQLFVAQRKAMMERVKAAPSEVLRTKEEWQRIEDVRQDPKEAEEKMQKHMKSLAKVYREEQSAMQERVWAKPAMNFRSKEEMQQIEESRQDPEEAKARMKDHLKNLAQTYKDHKDGMVKRVQAKPIMNIRPKEERQRIEEMRQDPDEARLKMTAHLQDLARSYKAQKLQIHQNVHAMPPATFHTPRSQEVVAKTLLKKMPLK